MPVRHMAMPQEAQADTPELIAEYASDAGKDIAWIRTRATGALWEVSGRVLERVLENPDDYELLEQDEAGNFVDEAGKVVIASQAPPPTVEEDDDF